MAFAVQLRNGAQARHSRREELENLHDDLLDRTIRGVESGMRAVQQIASSRNGQMPNHDILALESKKEKEKESESVQQTVGSHIQRASTTHLVARAFSEEGVFSESESRARYNSCLQLATEHAKTKEIRSNFLYGEEVREVEQLDEDRDRLMGNLQKFNLLFDRKQDELLESDAPEHIFSLLSEINKMRVAIRAQLEDIRGVRSQVSEYYEKKIETVEGKSCDGAIQAVYEPYKKRKKEFEEAMQIACDQDNRESERIEKELKEALGIVSAEVDNSCKLLSHISTEISNEHEQEMKMLKLKMDAVEKSCNLFLAYRKQDYEEEMAEKEHKLAWATLLLSKDKQESEHKLAWSKFTNECEKKTKLLTTADDVEEETEKTSNSQEEQTTRDSIKEDSTTKGEIIYVDFREALIAKHGTANKQT